MENVDAVCNASGVFMDNKISTSTREKTHKKSENNTTRPESMRRPSYDDDDDDDEKDDDGEDQI